MTFHTPAEKAFLWEKEKMLVTRIFSSSYNAFYKAKFKDKFNVMSDIEFDVCKLFQFGQCLKSQ